MYVFKINYYLKPKINYEYQLSVQPIRPTLLTLSLSVYFRLLLGPLGLDKYSKFLVPGMGNQ